MRFLRRVLILLCTSVLTLAAGLSMTAENVPSTLNGAIIIDAGQAQGLLGQAHFVDTRVLPDYLTGHLPGALHIHYKERSARSVDFSPAQDDVPGFIGRLRKFVPDTASPVVFYCNGIACWKSYKGARAALEHGYQKVYWFRNGMAEWQQLRFAVVRE